MRQNTIQEIIFKVNITVPGKSIPTARNHSFTQGIALILKIAERPFRSNRLLGWSIFL